MIVTYDVCKRAVDLCGLFQNLNVRRCWISNTDFLSDVNNSEVNSNEQRRVLPLH